LIHFYKRRRVACGWRRDDSVTSIMFVACQFNFNYDFSPQKCTLASSW